MANVGKFLFHSDYPIDKIVAVKDGGPTTAGSYASADASFAHGLPEAPLCILSWSTSSDFSNTHDNIESVLRYDIPYVVVSSDASSVKVHITNNTSATVGVYWRVIMLAQPGSVNNFVAPVTPSPFYLNTDYNYFKIFKEGSTTGSSVTHGLGYRPYVLAWYESGGTIKPLTTPIVSSSNSPRVRVENDALYFNMGYATKIYYRIYVDG